MRAISLEQSNIIITRRWRRPRNAILNLTLMQRGKLYTACHMQSGKKSINMRHRKNNKKFMRKQSRYTQK